MSCGSKTNFGSRSICQRNILSALHEAPAPLGHHCGGGGRPVKELVCGWLLWGMDSRCALLFFKYKEFQVEISCLIFPPSFSSLSPLLQLWNYVQIASPEHEEPTYRLLHFAFLILYHAPAGLWPRCSSIWFSAGWHTESQLLGEQIAQCGVNVCISGTVEYPQEPGCQ